jgi:hypothetical protein
LLLDLADLLDVLRQPHQQVPPTLRVVVSRPRNIIVTFTFARWLRKRSTCPFFVL